MTVSDFPRALIFAHFDLDNIVDAHVLRSLATYRGVFQHVVFVTTVELSNKAEVLPFVDTLIERPNVGLDFYSWKVGLDSLPTPEEFFEVIFCNDSVYGPMFDLQQALLSPQIKDTDFWGMTASYQIEPHVQSYFFVMRHSLFARGAAQAFWNTVEALPTKEAVIETYEVKMASWFRTRGYRIGAVYSVHAADLRNPSLESWEEILAAGVPYVKVALMRIHLNSADIRILFDYLRAISDYPVALMEQHALRTRARVANPSVLTC